MSDKVFVNHLGQEIKPGEKVICVTTGYSNDVNVSTGIFLGMKNGGCQVRVADRRFVYNGPGDSYWVDCERTTTLQLNRMYKFVD